MIPLDFVLVHGTTQAPVGWGRLAGALEKRGHRAIAPDVPTDQPDLLSADYARVISAQVQGKVDKPVLVAHSGAGLLRLRARNPVGASHLAWLAGAVPASPLAPVSATKPRSRPPRWSILTQLVVRTSSESSTATMSL
jgi:hypothetical protein